MIVTQQAVLVLVLCRSERVNALAPQLSKSAQTRRTRLPDVCCRHSCNVDRNRKQAVFKFEWLAQERSLQHE